MEQGFLFLHETPYPLCGFENVTRASNVVVSSKWVKFSFGWTVPLWHNFNYLYVCIVIIIFFSEIWFYYTRCYTTLCFPLQKCMIKYTLTFIVGTWYTLLVQVYRVHHLGVLQNIFLIGTWLKQVDWIIMITHSVLDAACITKTAY